MDSIFREIVRQTTNFAPGDEEAWRSLYEPVYPEPPGAVSVIRNERYGPHERNTLDVYFSTDHVKAGKPVLLYVHGGGFFSGDKSWSEKVYANIGHCFAQHGVVVVTINHQLVPHVVYPGGANDIQMARQWIFDNISKQEFGQGSTDKVILFGHSSGGAHIAMNLFAAGDSNRAVEAEIFPPVAGVVFLSVPFCFDCTKPVRRQVVRQYFGSEEEAVWGPKCPLGLFKGLPPASPCLHSEKVPIYIGSVKWEVKETADASIAFLNAYRERSIPAGTLPEFHILDKHNHLRLVEH